MIMLKPRLIFPLVIGVGLLLQFWTYFTYPNTKEATGAQYTLNYIFSGKATWFGQPQNEYDPAMYAFAQAVNMDLPAGARVQYIKDTRDGTDLDRYFKINYWMNGFHNNSYDFTPSPKEDEVEEIMAKSHSEYLITYSKVLPTYALLGTDSTEKKGKLFRLVDGSLRLEKQYD